MIRREGRGKGDDAVDILVDRLAVPCENLSSHDDASTVGRAVRRDIVDNRAAILDVTNGNPNTAPRRLDKVVADEGRAEVTVRDGPDEVAQRTAVGQRVILRLGFLKTRAELGHLGIPVDTLELREGIFAAEEIDHGVERAHVSEAGKIVQR